MKSNIELESQVERFRLALQGEGDHIWDWDLTTQTLLLFPACPWLSDINSDTTQDDPALANLTAPNSTPCLTVPSGTLALDSTRCNAQVWFNRIHPQDLPGVQREITAHLEGKTTRFASKYRFLQPEGRYCWVLSRGHAVRNLANEPIRMVGLQTDISYWKRNHTKPVADALHDSLTGLPNRVSLMDALRHAGERSSRQPEFLFAVLFIDLDRFKMINDSLGHRVGDQLLIEIAQRLAAQLRPDDTIARLGGDEFVIVLQNIQSLEKALATTEALLQELSIPFCIEGRDIFTSASIGIALSSTGFIHPENLLRDADLAMYRAKSEGRGRYALFHPRMHTSAVAMLELETDLRRALERNELRLYYQPIVSLRTNRLVGFEALIRWQHPQQGLISPAKFVPIAEETGLIQPIGQWVLQEACMQMRRWQQQFPEWQSLTVNVNLSSHQFTPYLVDQVRQILAETELAGQSLKLEITESVLMSHAESAITTLSQLKELGIQLAIDDFGTGYSSLSYLHRFPIDTLKVDRAFIQRVDVDGEQLAIVRTIITLAWNLGMEVVAEGVETPKQLAQLRSLRCEYAQGYLFSKPQDVKSTEELLTQELVEHHFDPFGGHRAV
ncbi:MAG: GGDEF and EAL domain-containing protein [Elainella sp. Prado103]|nr:GGDEF and EAL domain-containing protein [Elainella sp. Prado103]